MSLRVCSVAGCPNLQPESRCLDHRRAYERGRGTKQERGYDSDYYAQRNADVRSLANGAVLTCWRCLTVIPPHDYSLGHCDDDRSTIHGPEHLRACNLANTRGSCPHASHISPAA